MRKKLVTKNNCAQIKVNKEMTMSDPKKAREQIVAKRNDIIQRSRYGLTLPQNKAISYIISKIKKDDAPNTLYEFDCNEFIGVMKLKKNSYTDIRKMIKDIADKSMFVKDPTGKDVLVRWLNIVRMDPGSGKIYLTIHEDMAPYVFGLLEQKAQDENVFFTAFKLKEIALMKHKYSPRVYELLRSYQANNQTWKFELGTGSEYDIFPRIAEPDPDTGAPIIPKNWYSWSLFERDVLKWAKEEINDYCPIKVDYQGSKIDFKGTKQRKTCVVEFIMLDKTNGEKKSTEEKINEEYSEVDADQRFHQVCFDEFLQADAEARKKELEIEEREDLDRRLEKSICPTYLASFQSFSDKEVEALYSACLSKIGDHIFTYRKGNLDNREDWAIDYTQEYYEKILATPDETKTSVFRRLLDCLKNDYDNIAFKIDEKWRNI